MVDQPTLDNYTTVRLLEEVANRARRHADAHRDDDAGRQFSLARTAAEEAALRYVHGRQLLRGEVVDPDTPEGSVVGLEGEAHGGSAAAETPTGAPGPSGDPEMAAEEPGDGSSAPSAPTEG